MVNPLYHFLIIHKEYERSHDGSEFLKQYYIFKNLTKDMVIELSDFYCHDWDTSKQYPHYHKLFDFRLKTAIKRGFYLMPSSPKYSIFILSTSPDNKLIAKIPKDAVTLQYPPVDIFKGKR